MRNGEGGREGEGKGAGKRRGREGEEERKRRGRGGEEEGKRRGRGGGGRECGREREKGR